MSANQNLKAKFDTAFNKLIYSNSVGHVFNDFLDILLYNFTLTDEMEFKKNPINDYKTEDFISLLNAFGDLSDNGGEGLHDALGDIFMEYLSFGKNGQYFTPEPICDMMAKMTGNYENYQTVLDPACGSGRMLLAAAKINRKLVFYGSDIDLTCVKMAVVNLVYNTLEGEIAWMNPLTLEHWCSFKVVKCRFTGLSFVHILGPNKTDMILRVKKTLDNNPQIKAQTEQTISEKQKVLGTQLSLF
ncbi:MAG: hypothetical protein RLZZ414_1385 [Bacteroidota bacterium]|jgi:type I restriction-modification system DNA methylase subunit